MSSASWQAALEAALAGLAGLATDGRTNQPRIAVVGIGQELRGDDAVGSIVARSLQEKLARFESLLVLDAGPAPESQTGPLRKFGPELVIFVDAAQIAEAPGTLRWLPWELTVGTSNSTHTLPIEMTAHYLSATLGCRVVVLGIQPGDMALGAALTPPVQGAADEVVAALLRVLPEFSR